MRAVRLVLMVLGIVFLVSAVVGGIVALTGDDGSTNANAADKAQARRWVVSYERQLHRWQLEGDATEKAAQRHDLRKVGRIVERIGRDGDLVRRRFSHVPSSVSDAPKLYRLLVAAGDAAAEWARIYRTDPPPYDASTKPGLKKAQALADAAVDFQQKQNAAVMATGVG